MHIDPYSVSVQEQRYKYETVFLQKYKLGTKKKSGLNGCEPIYHNQERQLRVIISQYKVRKTIQ